MKPQNCDLTWIQGQLTLARWHLDAAASSAADAVRHQLQKARDVYERTRISLARADLSEEQLALIERELAAVRVRLETNGERS